MDTNEYLEALDALSLALQTLQVCRAKTAPAGRVPLAALSEAHNNITKASRTLFFMALSEGIDLDAAYHEREERENLQQELLF